MEKKGIIIIAVLAFLYWYTKTPNYIDEITGVELKYHIEYTAGASKGDTLPMILSLHGNGDTYDNFFQYTFKDFTTPARVILFEAPNKYWPYDIQQLANYSAAIATIAENLQNDYSTTKKPLLFGFSGGAVMAYFSALTHCEEYSAIVALSGMLKSPMIPANFSMDDNCHVVGFHGEKDNVLSISQAEYAIDELDDYSDNVEFSRFDGGHLDGLRKYKTLVFDKIVQLL